MRHVRDVALLAAMLISGCGGAPEPQTPNQADELPEARSDEIIPFPKSKTHSMSVTRDGQVVRVNITHVCKRELGGERVRCPSDPNMQDQVELVILEVGDDNAQQQRRIPIGPPDRRGSLTFDLLRVLPADFPKSGRSTVTVQVFDRITTGGAPTLDWNVQVQQCASGPDVCLAKPVEVSDIMTPRLAQRRAAQDDANKVTFAKIKGECGVNAPTAYACDALYNWLTHRAPTLAQTPEIQAYIADARTTLDAAEPTLERLREERDWPSLDLNVCAQATGPTGADVKQACKPLRSFLATYPNTAHSIEIHNVLDPADQRAAAIDAKEEAAAKKRADEAVRQQEADKQAARAKQRLQCMAVCRMKCSNALRFDECFAACPALCQ